MFHTGDRVLVCTSYGELLAVVLGIVDAGTYRVRPLHPAFVDYRNGIYAREAEVRTRWTRRGRADAEAGELVHVAAGVDGQEHARRCGDAATAEAGEADRPGHG